MTRRTKRLVLSGVFFLLVGVPMVYVFVTWAPAQPFRVRLDPAQPSSYAAAYVGVARGDGASDRNYLLVENTTTTPMHVMRLTSYVENPVVHSPCAREASGSARELAWRTEWGQVIPPGGTAHMEIITPWSNTPDMISGRGRVEYVTLSGTKAGFVRFSQWLFDKLPTNLDYLVPDLRPDLGMASVVPAEKLSPSSP